MDLKTEGIEDQMQLLKDELLEQCLLIESLREENSSLSSRLG